MGYRIDFTQGSLVDLRDLLDFIRDENAEAADRFREALLDHIDVLKSFPRIGVAVSHRRGIRKLLHSPIIVYYRVREATKKIEIMELRHVSRRPQRH